MASLLKYPSFHDSKANAYDKWGIFESERTIAEEVWKYSGLAEGRRHPLTYIMEACDDIAYSVIDAEDTIKKGYASFYDLMDFLEHHTNGDEVIGRVIEKSRKKNLQFREPDDLSSPELIDMSMQMFRVFAIFEMVDSGVGVRSRVYTRLIAFAAVFLAGFFRRLTGPFSAAPELGPHQARCRVRLR